MDCVYTHAQNDMFLYVLAFFGLLELVGFNRWLFRRVIMCVAATRPCKIVRYNGEDVLRRFHLIELPFDGMTVVLHQFCRSDPDRGLHDHPWAFGASFILSGGYFERRVAYSNNPIGKPKEEVPVIERWYGPGTMNTFVGHDFHRVFVPTDTDCWSLFLSGPRVKTWGFLKAARDLYEYVSYSRTVQDLDGRWWNDARYAPLYYKLFEISPA